MRDRVSTCDLQYAELRKQILAGLDKLEQANCDIGAAAIELIKAGVLLAIATTGPAATLAGITAQLEQLGELFPREAAAAEAARTFPSIRGHA